MDIIKKDNSMKVLVTTVLFFGFLGYFMTGDSGSGMELAGISFSVILFAYALDEGLKHW